MSKKQPPQLNKRYTAEFKSEALKLAERFSKENYSWQPKTLALNANWQSKQRS